VAIVGDFNDWSADKDVMKLDSNNNVWKGALSLKPGHTHEFRYLVDGHSWLNDEDADGYSPTEFYSENCVLNV
jgi:1,4-alpha-glucan branching enzyme